MCVLKVDFRSPIWVCFIFCLSVFKMRIHIFRLLEDKLQSLLILFLKSNVLNVHTSEIIKNTLTYKVNVFSEFVILFESHTITIQIQSCIPMLMHWWDPLEMWGFSTRKCGSFTVWLLASTIRLSLIGENSYLNQNKEMLEKSEVSCSCFQAEFQRLALGFKCDMFTLEKRLRLEERSRDLAEENVRREVSSCQGLLQVSVHMCVSLSSFFSTKELYLGVFTFSVLGEWTLHFVMITHRIFVVPLCSPFFNNTKIGPAHLFRSKQKQTMGGYLPCRCRKDCSILFLQLSCLIITLHQ